MKYYLQGVLILFLVYSCTSGKQEKANKINEYCKITNGTADCLDVTVNPDTATLSAKITASSKKVLVIFTGRAISGRGLLDQRFLENDQIFEELKKYSIYLLYVDEMKKVNGAMASDSRNMDYQQSRFNTASQPYYVTFLKGVKQCESGYLNQDNMILNFLRCSAHS